MIIAPVMVDLRRPLSESQFDEIHRALLDHLLVFLPSQPISDQQQKDFAGATSFRTTAGCAA